MKIRLRSILRHKMKMKFSKPFIRDRKRPENAEQMLKEKMAEKVDKIKQMGIELSRVGVGFLDDLNPIEYIWKNIKRPPFCSFFDCVESLKHMIKSSHLLAGGSKSLCQFLYIQRVSIPVSFSPPFPDPQDMTVISAVIKIEKPVVFI